MMVSKIKLLLTVLAISMTGVSAAAETVCQDLWSIRAIRVSHGLFMSFVEKNEQGPACDLVVESFEFNEADSSLALRIRPASFCPLDALASRRAQFVWMLPFNLRQGSELRLIVNERETGMMKIDGTSASFEGGCQ